MGEISGDAARSAQLPTRVRWRIVALLLVGSAIMYVLRSNMSIASETIATELGISKVRLGLIPAGFLWGYALFQLPGGLLSNAWGGRRVFTLIMAAWTVLTLLTALPLVGATSAAILTYLVLVRFAMGAAQAPFFPSYVGVVERWLPPRRWGLANGLVSTALTLGAAATGPLMAWLIVHVGWRLGFAVLAPLGVALAGLWWWYARDEPREHWAPNAAELSLIGDRPAAAARSERPLWRLVLTDRNILLLTLSYFCMSYVFWMFFNWFAFYLVDGRGFTTQAAGAFFGVQWVVGAVGATAGGVQCDRLVTALGPRRGYALAVVPGLLATALFVVAGALVQSPTLAVAMFAIAFGANQITEAGYWTATMAVAGSNADAASGVLNTGGVVVGGIGALIVPWTAETLGWGAALASGAVIAVFGAACWLGIDAGRPMRGSGTAA